jgi:hypothetical protein
VPRLIDKDDMFNMILGVYLKYAVFSRRQLSSSVCLLLVSSSSWDPFIQNCQLCRWTPSTCSHCVDCRFESGYMLAASSTTCDEAQSWTQGPSRRLVGSSSSRPFVAAQTTQGHRTFYPSARCSRTSYSVLALARCANLDFACVIRLRQSSPL